MEDDLGLGGLETGTGSDGAGGAAAELDVAVDVEARPAKRPRLGRRPGDILSAIDADTTCSGWQRSLRKQMLNIGVERSDDPIVVVCRQSEELLAAFRRFGDAALDIFFEA